MPFIPAAFLRFLNRLPARPRMFDQRLGPLLTVSLLDPERERVLTVAEYAKADGGALVRFDEPAERSFAAVPALDDDAADRLQAVIRGARRKAV